VGDSRAYRLDPQGLVPLTRDHTPAGEQLARQGGGRDVLRTHPHGHLLLRVVGGEERPSEAELFELSLSGSRSALVLCTDGVEAVLTETRFRELLAPALEGDLETAARAVLDEVLRGGAPDNVTLLLLARAGNGAAPQ
jgi:PPM family protein phosphatase